mmetsp:Transcript_2577/g.6886  ORF Transcript_2577/g.6886 Transcript_2577/m.6886 type:complete len:280 (+) Transcript_2577:899-1738(+)
MTPVSRIVFQGGLPLGKRKAARRSGGQLSSSYHVSEAVEHGRLPGGSLLACKTACEPEALECDVLEDEQAGGHRHRLHAHAAVRHQRAAIAQLARHHDGRVAAHTVEPKLRAGQSGSLDILPRTRLCGDDVGSQCLQLPGNLFPVVARPDQVDRAQPPRARQLDEAAADRARCAILYDHIARRQAHKTLKHRQRRGGVDGQSGCGLKRDVLPHSMERRRSKRASGTPRANARLKRYNQVADRETLHLWADRRNPPHTLMPRHAGQRRAQRVLALDCVDV